MNFLLSIVIFSIDFFQHETRQCCLPVAGHTEYGFMIRGFKLESVGGGGGRVGGAV